ncbi:kinase-like domain-containing protein [Mycena rosella]|uniref:Kinase-like domain-containing protein n=1 Tax=Mycena rosella TaxID=1033263 RepID=A0AAD7G464_MYCRO|nr:kinase-like domain-containing protein [Mycena rosella]
MFAIFATLVLCLSSFSSVLESSRCRTISAAERALDRTVVVFGAVAIKVTRRVSPLPPPPPTRTAPTSITPTSTFLYQPSVAPWVILACNLAVLLLLIATALVKTGLFSYVVKNTPRLFKAFADASRTFAFTVFAALPLFIAGDATRLYRLQSGQTTSPLIKRGGSRKAISIWNFGAAFDIDLLLKAYGRLLTVLIAGLQTATKSVGYAALLDILRARPQVTPPALLLHPYDIQEMLRTALPGPRAPVDFSNTPRATDDLWGSDGWKVLGLWKGFDEKKLDPRMLRLVSELGAGAFGTVVKVEYGKAILAVKKVQKRDDSQDSQSPGDLYWALAAEIDVHATMYDHPAFPALQGVFHGPDSYFLVMDCGQRSFAEVDVTGRTQALFFAAQLTLALHALHKRGIVHCDLKPANLLRDRKGNLLVIDYGLALLFELPSRQRFPEWHALREAGTDAFPPMWPTEANPQTGYIRGGSPGYISPAALVRVPPNTHENPRRDAIFHKRRCSFGADWYAFGVILHWWLTGAEPYFFTPGVFVANPAHQLSAVDVDFLTRLMSATKPTRFESYEDLKGHAIWADQPSWDLVEASYCL